MGITVDHAAAGGVPREAGGWEWRDAHGQRHRLDGPAVIRADGTKEWWYQGRWHCVDGPAVTWSDGCQFWYVHDQLHRVDGPAVTWSDGTHAWWVHGQEITAEVTAWMSEQGITWPFTPEQQAEFALRWG